MQAGNEMRMRIPTTLFFKTASTLLIALLLLSVIFLASTAYFVLVPVAKRSADDLAALLVLSAQTWTELPPETRPDFEAELISAHGIKLRKVEHPLEVTDHLPFYLYQRLLQRALAQRLGDKPRITIGANPQTPKWIWIDIPVKQHSLRFGISAERIGARPPIVLLAMAIAVLLLAISTAVIIAQRLSRPLALLSAATTAVGRGEKDFVLEEKGPDEIVTLARNFRKMSQEISALLENRTVLLAGISHDLRTPLTRIRLALEINAGSPDASLHSRIENDIEEMEQLLEQALLLARGVNKEEGLQQRDLVKLLSTLAAQIEADGQEQYSASHCRVEFQLDAALTSSWLLPLPEKNLLRVLQNLISNALRYGNNKPVIIRLAKQADLPLITILDRGPGIPEDQREAIFRPFYRLENSRNQQTGGNGLGLAIVRQLCQAQGWEISVHSREGGGSEMRLLLGRSNA